MLVEFHSPRHHGPDRLGEWVILIPGGCAQSFRITWIRSQPCDFSTKSGKLRLVLVQSVGFLFQRGDATRGGVALLLLTLDLCGQRLLLLLESQNLASEMRGLTRFMDSNSDDSRQRRSNNDLLQHGHD